MKLKLLLCTAALLVASACAARPRPVALEAAPREDRSRFILCGDARPRLPIEVWRTRSDAERRLVFERIADRDPAFVLNTGDVVMEGDDTDDWARFDGESADIRTKGIPYFAGLGNHDLAGDTDIALHQFGLRFPSGRKRRFVLRHRDAAVVMLDTNLREIPRPDAEDQLAWLDETLDALDADPACRVVIVTTHHPAVTNATLHEPSRWVRAEVLPRMVRRTKPQMLFSGHVHSYERFLAGRIHCVVSGGAGAPLVTLRPPAEQTFTDLHRGTKTFHVCEFVHEPDSLRMRMDYLDLSSDPAGIWREGDEVVLPKSPAAERAR